MSYRVLISWLALSSGCGGAADAPADAPAGGGGHVDTADVGCIDAPVVRWANFGQGFLREQCQTCHGSTTIERYGAPPDVVFDTEADAIRQAPRIRARSIGPSPTMPPQGGVSESDRALLELWLSCDPAMQSEEG